MVRKDFLMMDDRLWTPEEWATWLKCLGYKAAVFGEKDSPFRGNRYQAVKTDTKR